jgi:flagellar motor switch protein FliM
MRMAAAGDVLSRKLKGGGIARSPLPDTELIGDTFARLCEDRLRPLARTVVGAMVLEARVVKLSEALQGISVPAMLGVIEVEDAASQGLLGIHTDLAYHLIDLMLGGDPAVAPAPTARTFTGIDMALGRMQLDALVAAFVEAVSAAFGRPLGKRIAVREQRQNAAQLRIAPDYADVLVFSVALDLGEAARTGNFQLLLPLATLDVLRASLQETTAEAAGRPDDLWRINMRLAAAAAPVPLDAVLHRQRLPLAGVQALKPGDVLEVPAGAIDEVQLVIAQPGGKSAVVATGRLGAFQGAKVVKLETPVDPRLRSHVARALA